MEGIRTLRDQQVDFGILTVVNDLTVKKPAELYNFFIKNGFPRMQFIPCVERNAATEEAMDYSVTVDAYRDFLCILFDVWYKNGQPLEMSIPGLMKKKKQREFNNRKTEQSSGCGPVNGISSVIADVGIIVPLSGEMRSTRDTGNSSAIRSSVSRH